MIQGKRVLVTGGAGSIGVEVVKQLSKKNDVFVIDINESGVFDVLQNEALIKRGVRGRVGDIRNMETLNEVFSTVRPEIIVHCAAYKHVPLNEEYPMECVNTNIIGTYNMIKASRDERWRADLEKFINISTDKVVNSKSIMGATKNVAELMVKNCGSPYTSVRFGNVEKSRGSVMLLWEKQIAQGGPVTVTDPKMTRYFMTIPEAVGLILEAIEYCNGGDIAVLDMGDPVKIIDVAKDMIAVSGKDIKIKITGARPGETLFEELMTEEEKQRAIKHKRIFIIK